MQKFVQKSVSSALMRKDPFAQESSQWVNSFADRISEVLISLATVEVGSSSSNRDINIRVSQLKMLLLRGIEKGRLSSHVLREDVLTTESVSMSVLSLVQQERRDKQKADDMYTTIRDHHKYLRAVSSENQVDKWEEATSRLSSLREYSDAASAMGDRLWVRDGLVWCSTLIKRFFFEGGWRFNPSRLSRGWGGRRPALCSSNVEVLQHRNEVSNGIIDAPRALRLLDVGSCYNPFLNPDVHLENQLKVTAIDLCPRDNCGVLQCDFLACPIIDDEHNLVQLKSSYSGDKLSSVKTLPAGGFDVVVMSLVLSYIPDSMMRAQMIAQAYKCLCCPSSSEPSKAGLLLLVDRGTIASKKNNQILSDWVVAIESQGFLLVRYDYIKNNGNAHAFAFQTIPRCSSDQQLIPIPIKID